MKCSYHASYQVALPQGHPFPMSKYPLLKERLLAEVFSYDDAVAPNALEVHIARLRRKLEPDGPAIRTMRGLGYMLKAS